MDASWLPFNVRCAHSTSAFGDVTTAVKPRMDGGSLGRLRFHRSQRPKDVPDDYYSGRRCNPQGRNDDPIGPPLASVGPCSPHL
jgi:hypothetical protein